MGHITEYNNKLIKSVYRKISDDINNDTINFVINHDLMFHLTDTRSARFQMYYFRTIANESYFNKTNSFFRDFKSQYSLQGIDNNFLNQLEGRKIEILQAIHNEELVKLYFETFRKAKIKYKNVTKEKDLGSFFAKLVHTFNPEKYCALDNPIKNYLGLGKDSFFIAFIVISQAYREWSDNNKDLIDKIRKGLIIIDKSNKLPNDKITNLKLLDLIFWTKADGSKIITKKVSP